ncbi:DUF1572 family protein [Flavihumibacter sp. CACIAM 22H1]|uniref:DUF1572 family protein n=1 Tax=Flavihumibacter sp. CACIAM 22H1 TaxID=1812911 RepID=UPI0007A82491|nr:DUF1572 family protein [Flavihumibacter sp. CACIAM 22H1]KYP15083.1 MAG: hypothetical protein A1D16_02535 [Flavihumibacter sp. CACIAM 22H1]
MSTEQLYLDSIRRQFNAYKTLGDHCLQQLTEEEINRSPASGSNSIAIIVQHMHGNLMSRFTNFLTEDGEKPWRQRDLEFTAARLLQPADLLQLWNEGWACLFTTLDSLQPTDLTKTVTIRTEPHAALDAINRQLAHHSSHVGQIILLTKMYKAENWQSLSIPRGQSRSFNEKMGQKT